MAERVNTNAWSTAMAAPVARAAITTVTEPGGRGTRLIRRLVVINLGLVALQPVSAGLFLSGYGPAVTLHGVGALALQLGALIQVVTALVLWNRRRIPARVAVGSIGFFVMVFLEVALGYSKQFWLHVPIGVGMFGGLIRQISWLDSLSSDRSSKRAPGKGTLQITSTS